MKSGQKQESNFTKSIHPKGDSKVSHMSLSNTRSRSNIDRDTDCGCDSYSRYCEAKSDEYDNRNMTVKDLDSISSNGTSAVDAQDLKLQSTTSTIGGKANADPSNSSYTLISNSNSPVPRSKLKLRKTSPSLKFQRQPQVELSNDSTDQSVRRGEGETETKLRPAFNTEAYLETSDSLTLSQFKSKRDSSKKCNELTFSNRLQATPSNISERTSSLESTMNVVDGENAERTNKKVYQETELLLKGQGENQYQSKIRNRNNEDRYANQSYDKYQTILNAPDGDGTSTCDNAHSVDFESPNESDINSEKGSCSAAVNTCDSSSTSCRSESTEHAKDEEELHSLSKINLAQHRNEVEFNSNSERNYDGDWAGENKPEGFASYFWSELSRGYEPDENEAVFNIKRQRVYVFLRIPWECEKFLFYGFLQCIDSFLFIFTFLPLRLLIIMLKLLARPWTLFIPQWYLSASQKCDLAKGVILFIGCLIMQYVDASVLYHLIRGQALIKLYIIFNLLDIGDKLLSSFGQDILDALMWTVADPKRRRTGVVMYLVTAVIYVVLHSTLVLFQASALNVAFNSHNPALLSILISNNAVELKGGVFKKFEKTNLFQMSCSDVRERFHFQALIIVVCMRNMTDFNWDIVRFIELIPYIVMLLASEVVVDGVKHAFITKFNNIPAKVYKEYTALLANDVINSRKKNAFSDVSDQVARRLGLTPLPVACVLIKVAIKCFKIESVLAVVNIVLVFLCLLIAKVAIGVVVYSWAIDYYRDYHQQQAKMSRRTRHKSGIDEDLLRCENNYHFHKKS